MDDLKALIKESGLSGVARWRSGTFLNSGARDIGSEIGYESYIQLTYLFKPEPNLDFKFTLTSVEIEGPAGTAFIPGANNEQGITTPGTPPLGRSSSSSSFVVDEAHFKYYWGDAPSFAGSQPVVTVGRQYFSEGEFGLAGDNAYRSTFGMRIDTSFGANFDAHAGVYRTESIASLAPWDNADSLSFQSSGLTVEGDDFLLAGLEYHGGEATIPGHDYRLVLRTDAAMNGFGAEEYIGISGNAETPWFSKTFLNGIRGEWVWVMNNVSDMDPEADLGLESNSFIVEVDLYNDGRSRISFAGAQIAQIEGLPVFANVDNDPFSEWDFTVNEAGDAFNFSREGPNYFPADFIGFGLQAEHRWGNSLHSTLTFYDGDRVNAAAADRPGMFRLNLRLPFSNNSSLSFDFITSGERSGIEDPITLLRGEYKIHF
ncbi:hypothetical protein IIA79_05250 [bacterium]|nr:hypothetical protein [bacterium]